MSALGKPTVAEREHYSFSRLSAWSICPYAWKMRYIDHLPGVGNAFSSYGTFVHSLLEGYANGKYQLWDLPEIYEWGFDAAVPEEFPANRFADLRKTYYEQGLDFLRQFEGYPHCKILGVEKKFALPIDDWALDGIIDLVYEDQGGRIIIRDYKSKASFKSKKEQAEYARQLYLYSEYVKSEYGKYPDELQFLQFRKNNTVKIPFKENDLKEAFDWAKGVVKEIRGAFDFPPRPDQFYCKNLCDNRHNCEFIMEGGD